MPPPSPSAAISQASAAAPSTPSTRSSTPPWPGMIVPESFTPKRRFTADSKRSPACAAIESGTRQKSAGHERAGPGQTASQPARDDRGGKPASAPDHVFFGDTRGQSFGPPIARPPK